MLLLWVISIELDWWRIEAMSTTKHVQNEGPNHCESRSTRSVP